MSVAFANASDGWAVGWYSDGSGIILATTDGGAHWSAQSAGAATFLTSVACADGTHAWALSGSTILATTDGGATWHAQSSAGAVLNGIAFRQCQGRLGGRLQRRYPRHH